MQEMIFPKEITARVQGLSYTTDELGRSGDTVVLFEDSYVLKISKDIPRLQREKERNDWLCDRLPVPETVAFCVLGDKGYYLRTCIKGKPLSDACYTEHPNLLTTLLAKASFLVSQVDVSECPFVSQENEGTDFVHGDFCLPNILAQDDEIAGFLDMENCGRGDAAFDLSWGVWSLAYNLHSPRYGEEFLSKTGRTLSRKDYQAYIPEDYRKETDT